MRLRSLAWAGCLLVPLGASAQERAEPSRPVEVDKSKGEEEQIRKREEWFIQSRGLRSERRPDLLRAQAVEELDRAQAARASELELAGETWSPLGPVGMTMLSWTMGRVSGRVSESGIAVDPANAPSRVRRDHR